MDIRASRIESQRVRATSNIGVYVRTASVNVNRISEDRLGNHVDGIRGGTTVVVNDSHAEGLGGISSNVVCGNREGCIGGVDTVSPNMGDKTHRIDGNVDRIILAVEEVVRIASGPRSAIDDEMHERQRVNTDIHAFNGGTTSQNAGNFNRVGAAVYHVGEDLAGISRGKNHARRTVIVPLVCEDRVARKGRRDFCIQSAVFILTDMIRSIDNNARSVVVVQTDNSNGIVNTLGEHIHNGNVVDTILQASEDIDGVISDTIVNGVHVRGCIRISIREDGQRDGTIETSRVAEMVRSSVNGEDKFILVVEDINISVGHRVIDAVVDRVEDRDLIASCRNAGEDRIQLIGGATIDGVGQHGSSAGRVSGNRNGTQAQASLTAIVDRGNNGVDSQRSRSERHEDSVSVRTTSDGVGDEHLIVTVSQRELRVVNRLEVVDIVTIVNGVDIGEHIEVMRGLRGENLDLAITRTAQRNIASAVRRNLILRQEPSAVKHFNIDRSSGTVQIGHNADHVVAGIEAVGDIHGVSTINNIDEGSVVRSGRSNSGCQRVMSGDGTILLGIAHVIGCGSVGNLRIMELRSNRDRFGVFTVGNRIISMDSVGVVVQASEARIHRIIGAVNNLEEDVGARGGGHIDDTRTEIATILIRSGLSSGQINNRLVEVDMNRFRSGATRSKFNFINGVITRIKRIVISRLDSITKCVEDNKCHTCLSSDLDATIRSDTVGAMRKSNLGIIENRTIGAVGHSE